MPGGEELREPLRFADDDDSDDLGGFGRGKRPFEDDEDEENGGWAINEDHSDRLWDSADDVTTNTARSFVRRLVLMCRKISRPLYFGRFRSRSTSAGLASSSRNRSAAWPS